MNFINWRKISLAQPFLFAAVPVFATYNEVKKIVLPEEVIPTLVAFEIFVAILYLVCFLFLRHWDRAAILSTALVTYLFFYRCLSYSVHFTAGANLPEWVLLSIYLILFLLLAPALTQPTFKIERFKINFDFPVLNVVLTQVSILLLLVNTFSIATYVCADTQLSNELLAQIHAPYNNVRLSLSKDKPQPDIYYVILDGFADWKALKQLWNFDDRTFDDYLKRKGFFVVNHSVSNYDRTEFSISSSLNMTYLDELPGKFNGHFEDLNVYSRLIHDSNVSRLLQKAGYKFVNVSSSANEYLPNADINLVTVPFNNFTIALMSLTPLYATEQYVPLMRDILIGRRLNPSGVMNQLCSIKGPKFVLLHTDLSHAPVLFDSDGTIRPMPPGAYMVNWGTPDEYFGQWKYTYKTAISWLDEIFVRSAVPPIVIVQSDHGSGIPFSQPKLWYNERMKNLNAYYFPQLHQTHLYDSITPVNSFRLLFNDYFGTSLPLLPDHAYCSADFAKAYEWHDVLPELNFRPDYFGDKDKLN